MPRELDECVNKLKRKGYSEEEAWKICRAALDKEKKKKKKKDKTDK